LNWRELQLNDPQSARVARDDAGYTKGYFEAQKLKPSGEGLRAPASNYASFVARALKPDSTVPAISQRIE
jgi:hypothetical protein